MSNVQEDITIITNEITTINDEITNINTDVDTLENEITDLDDDVESHLTIIAAEQILQDERLLAIEENDQGCIFSFSRSDFFTQSFTCDRLLHHLNFITEILLFYFSCTGVYCCTSDSRC